MMNGRQIRGSATGRKLIAQSRECVGVRLLACACVVAVGLRLNRRKAEKNQPCAHSPKIRFGMNPLPMETSYHNAAGELNRPNGTIDHEVLHASHGRKGGWASRRWYEGVEHLIWFQSAATQWDHRPDSRVEARASLLTEGRRTQQFGSFIGILVHPKSGDTDAPLASFECGLSACVVKEAACFVACSSKRR